MLTILIPAYANSITLSRALSTLSRQSIAHKITVIISDDCPSRPIDENILLEYKNVFLSLNLIRQRYNLGVLSNKAALYNQVETEYFAFLEHDDWYHDEFFLERQTYLLSVNLKAAFFFGNTITSDNLQLLDGNSDKPYMYLYPYPLKNTYLGVYYKYILGSEFMHRLSHSTPDQPFNTSWSAIIFRTKCVRLLGGFGTGYSLSPAEAAFLNVYREEEHFCILYLLASVYDVLIEMNPSVVRGIEPTSFSRSISHPGRKFNQDSAVYAYYKAAYALYHFRNGRYIREGILALYHSLIKAKIAEKSLGTDAFLKSYQLDSSDSCFLSDFIRSKFLHA